MDLYEAIEKRRTIRAFKRGATEEQLHKIILAGTKAPSGWNLQPWEFIIVNDPKIIDKIAELKYQQTLRTPPDFFSDSKERDVSVIEQRTMRQKTAYQNASVIAVVVNRRGWAAIASAWLCIENMYLAAVAEGLGSLTSSFWGKAKSEVERILHLPEGYKLVNVVVLGVPADEGYNRDINPYVSRRPEFSWLHRNTFQ